MLPDGGVFDPVADPFTFEIDSGSGAVFSVTIPGGALSADRMGVLHASSVSTVPANGDATIRIVKSRTGNCYGLQFKARKLGLPNVDSTMNLRVVVGSNVLSQSLMFRNISGHLLLP